MRKLSEIEHRVLTRIPQNGGSYCPSEDVAAEPMIMDTLKALVRKKRLYVDEFDLVSFRLTQWGWNDAQA